METNIVFKKFDVSGETKENAFEQTPFTASYDMWVNATQAFNKFKDTYEGALSDVVIKQFMLDYIKSKKIAPGAAAYIVNRSAIQDTRKRPYVTTDIKHEGPSREAKIFEIYDRETGAVLLRTTATEVPQINKETGEPIKDEEGNVRMRISSETKNAAKKMAADLYINNGYKGNLACRKIKQDINGDNVVFTMDYAPSSKSRCGLYTVFGYVNE